MRLFERIYYKSITKSIVSAVKKWSRDRDIYLLGANERTLKLSRFLRKDGISISGVVDNNAHMYDGHWMHMIVKPLDTYSGKEGYLILEEICETPIVKKLLNKLDQSDFFICKASKFIRIIDKIDHLNGIRKGWQIYTRIRKQFQGSVLLMCPYPGTGDAYITGMYLQKYIDDKGINDYKILVPSRSFFTILTLFGINSFNIIVIPRKDMNNLKNWVAYKGEYSLNLHYLMYWGLPYQTVAIFEGYKGLSFPQIFKACTFGLSMDVIPAKMAQNISHLDAEQKVKKMGLAVGKTVVIAPYVNSFEDELDIAWWEGLVIRLQERGFCVVTNCIGDELPIGNTKSVAFPYSEIIPMMDVCGFFIGMRSGLCDIITESTCRKIVIYQNFITKRRMDFFSLFHLNPNQSLTELKYTGTDDSKEEIYETILNGGYFA